MLSLFWAVLATMMVPIQATIIPVFLLIKDLGLVNTRTGLILPVIGTAFGTFLMRQYFLQMPKELGEAATVDGASQWQVFYKVYARRVGPPLATLAVLAFAAYWNEFFRPLIFLSTPSKFTLPLGLVTLQGYLGTGSVSVVLAGVILSLIPTPDHLPVRAAAPGRGPDLRIRQGMTTEPPNLRSGAAGEPGGAGRPRPAFHFAPERNWMNDPNGLPRELYLDVDGRLLSRPARELDGARRETLITSLVHGRGTVDLKLSGRAAHATELSVTQVRGEAAAIRVRLAGPSCEDVEVTATADSVQITEGLRTLTAIQPAPPDGDSRVGRVGHLSNHQRGIRCCF